MEYEEPAYHLPIGWINQTEGAGRPAGIYLLDGVVRLAARFSGAEQLLLEAGALYIATLCFNAAYERAGRAADISPVVARALACAGGEN